MCNHWLYSSELPQLLNRETDKQWHLDIRSLISEVQPGVSGEELGSQGMGIWTALQRWEGDDNQSGMNS